MMNDPTTAYCNMSCRDERRRRARMARMTRTSRAVVVVIGSRRGDEEDHEDFEKIRGRKKVRKTIFLAKVHNLISGRAFRWRCGATTIKKKKKKTRALNKNFTHRTVLVQQFNKNRCSTSMQKATFRSKLGHENSRSRCSPSPSRAHSLRARSLVRGSIEYCIVRVEAKE